VTTELGGGLGNFRPADESFVVSATVSRAETAIGHQKCDRDEVLAVPSRCGWLCGASIAAIADNR